LANPIWCANFIDQIRTGAFSIMVVDVPAYLWHKMHAVRQQCYKWFPYYSVACTYSRSQNNVNVVYCNYKEITSSYSEITDRNLSQSMPNVAIIYKMFVWNFEETCDI